VLRENSIKHSAVQHPAHQDKLLQACRQAFVKLQRLDRFVVESGLILNLSGA